MKIPRDISSNSLIQALRLFDYKITRQHGSHIRITTEMNGTHHETIPNHNPIKIGTLISILKSIARHHQISLEELLQKIDL